ncbi:MAG: hypothetical protein MJ211_08960 [Bacteroidales bacterium]|nr:hypothetical protein [Bacteroidales bacterium]
MGKFILKAALFCLLTITISYSLDIFISKAFRPGNTCYAWNDIYNNNVNSDIVIFGSSRAIQHFDSQIIEDSLSVSAYNLGLAGARIDISYLRLLELKKYAKKMPKIITLEVGFNTLENEYQMYLHHQIFPFMLFNKNVYECTKHLEGFSKDQYWIPILRYSGYIFKCYENSLLKNSNIITTKGYIGFDNHFDSKGFEERKKENFSKTHIIDSLHLNFLEKFVCFCSKENIQLNFVYTPEYYYGRKFFKNRLEVITFFQKYSESLGIPFKDFSNDTIINYNTEYFRDVQHLNKRGAEKFTSEMYIPWIKELYGL